MDHVARAGKLSPELRLVQAISEFEADLTLQERIVLHRDKSRPISKDDVMRLTAEIDILQTDNLGKRGCGPRLTTFLENVNDFVALGDILVGASSSLVARGVWTSVRFATLAISKHSPYIDKFSNLFMELGQAGPRLDNLVGIYPHCKALQDALYEYYIVVISLCRAILNLSRKSTVARFLTNFGQVVESLTKESKRWTSIIKAEIRLQNAKHSQEESRKNERFRFLMKKNLELHRVEQQEHTRQRILNACSKYDYRTIWKQTRKSGTSMLYRESTTYQRWKQNDHACTLWYHGKLGSGKSVLLSNIVDDVFLQQDLSVAFFFCRHDDDQSLQASTIIGSLARQLLQRKSNLDHLADRFKMTALHPSVDELMGVLKDEMTRPLHFVLDGLDDCDKIQRRQVLEYLSELQLHVPLLLCASSRLDVTELEKGYCENGIKQLFETMPSANPEIGHYIDKEVDRCISTGELSVDDNSLVEKIKAELLSKSHGMFLWVYLQIVSLCTMESDKEVRSALSDLPSELSGVYTRLLQNVAKPVSKHQKILFSLVMAALRPLTEAELREALSIECGNIEYDPASTINNMSKIVQSCAGLIHVEEEDRTVRLIHHSARLFLQTDYITPILSSVNSQFMAEVVLTYLNSTRFETQLCLKGKPTLAPESLPAALLIEHVPYASWFIRPTAPNGKSKINLQSFAKPRRSVEYPFTAYAQDFWMPHVENASWNDGISEWLICAIEKKRISVSAVYEGRTILQLAVKKRWSPLLSLVLQQEPAFEDKRTAIRMAAKLKDHHSMTTILQTCRDVKGMLFDAITDDSSNLLDLLLTEQLELKLCSLNENEQTCNITKLKP